MASLAPAYVPRRPTETVLHQLVRANLESFLAYARANYDGGLPRYVEQEFRAYIRCGDFYALVVIMLRTVAEGVFGGASGPSRCPQAAHNLALATAR